ncbi:MAG: Helix-hairpin-helix motif, partial [Solirubrobacterales bacterium]|nr:Helix-hairpin-helix motif [Solirubrobacterales bacterium]
PEPEPPDWLAAAPEGAGEEKGEEKGGRRGILGRLRGGEREGEEAAEDTGLVNVNDASFEQLREIGFSVTQATRVITYREREQGFDSVDDLDVVPGMPKSFLNEVKKNLTV